MIVPPPPSCLAFHTPSVAADWSADISALRAMYTTWGSPASLSSWNDPSNPSPCVSTWRGVSCDAGQLTGNVITVDLGNVGGIAGTVDPSVGNLTSLSTLSLGGNQMSGPIPPTVSQLTSLTFFNIGANKLSGQIPQQLSTLVNLDAMYMDTNLLTGTLPAALSSIYARRGNSQFTVHNNAMLCGDYSAFSNLDHSLTNLGNACPTPPCELALTKNVISVPALMGYSTYVPSGDTVKVPARQWEITWTVWV